MYSQNKEEDVILKYFESIGMQAGTFLSIGENDGETLSNVRALALKGWCGVMVEPSPTAFRKLKALYSGSKKGCFYAYELAIGTHNGNAILHDSGCLLNKGDTALVSTLVEEEKKRFQSVLTYTPIDVKVFRWKTFLNRLKLKQFDFVSIDAEGFDLAILEQMDLGSLGVRVLCIEWNGNAAMKTAFDKLMSGYNVIYTSAENLIYAK